MVYGYFFQKQMVTAITLAMTEQKLNNEGNVDLNGEAKPYTIANELYQKGLMYYQRYRAVDNLIAIDFFLAAK